MSEKIENMLRGVDFSKGSDHKEMLKNQLFDTSDEINIDDMEMVYAAVQNPDKQIKEDKSKRKPSFI